MHDNKGPDPHIVLPEYHNLQQIFNTLTDKVRTAGGLQMGTFVITDELAGLMVVGPMVAMIHMSRIIATIGQSPLVKMPGH